MKFRKIAIIILTLCAVVLTTVGCKSASAETTNKTTITTVKKGNLSVSVTGTGSLTYSTTEDMAFQIAGYVAEVLVKEGESVKKGQELAKLDTSEWDKQVKTVEKALVTAQRNLTTKERALTKSQDLVTSRENSIEKAMRTDISKGNDIARAERLVTSKELSLRQAEADLKTAINNRDQIAEVKAAQDEIDNAQFRIDFIDAVRKGMYGLTTTSFDYWVDQENAAKDELENAQNNLKRILEGTSTKVTADVALQVEKSQIQMEQSQLALEEAKIAVETAKGAIIDAQLAKKDSEQGVKNAQMDLEDAEIAVRNAEMDIEDARQAVEDAQSNLDEVKALSPIITASFDGYVPKINVKGGDEVFKGTVAMQLADPTQYEAVILVSERNISSLKVGQNATVSLDALSGLTLPAQITKIATLASSSQGVVNYQVTVKLTSTQPVTRRI